MKVPFLKLIQIILVLPSVTMAQVIIPANTILSTTANTKITIVTPNTIVNKSAFDFSTSKLDLDLNGAAQSISGNLFIENLALSTNGIKSIDGNLTITDKIQFDNGILTPSAASKLLFIGPKDGIGGGNNNSYCDGVFYSNGSGKRIFPLGTGNIFTPIQFESITGEVGVKLNAGSASLSFDPADITSINQAFYWEIKTDPTKINSKVTLSLNNIDALTTNAEGSITVIQANNVGGQGQNLGSSSLSINSSPPSISSRENVSASILAIGKERKITVRVHDLITPSTLDGQNDKLTIENIEKFDHNKVTLLDRWGSRVTEWTNFSNDLSYDFSKLSTGNYICIVEYGNAGEPNHVEQQMVTVLKTN